MLYTHTHTHTHDKAKFKALFVFLIFLFFFKTSSFGQSNCLSSLNILCAKQADNFVSINDTSDCWVKFTGTGDTVNLFLLPIIDTTNFNEHYMYLYRGNCSNLILLDDANYFDEYVFLKDTVYYLRIFPSGEQISHNINVCFMKDWDPVLSVSDGVNESNTPLDFSCLIGFVNYPCEKDMEPILMCANNTLHFTFGAEGLGSPDHKFKIVFDHDNSVYNSYYCDVDDYSSCMDFNKTFDNPGVYPFEMTFYYSWNNGGAFFPVTVFEGNIIVIDKPGNIIISNTPDYLCDNDEICQPSASSAYATSWSNSSSGFPVSGHPNCYYAQFDHIDFLYHAENICGYKNSSITIPVKLFTDFDVPNPICVNQDAQFGNIQFCQNSNYDFNYFRWDFGDGNISVSQNPLHSYANSGIYDVTLIAGTHFWDGDQWITYTTTMTKSVTVNIPAPTPILQGNMNTCITSGIYTITNPQEGTIYTWEIIPSTAGSISPPATGSSVEITWNTANFPDSAIIAITSNNGCIESNRYKIWRCCGRIDRVLNSSNTSTPLTNGETYYLNGTNTFSGTNITHTNVNFYMAPDAKIIINPNSSVSFVNSRFQAGCGYMWDGIYIDQTASLTVNGATDNLSKISDAINGVVSDLGTQYTIINTTFNKNLIGITVKNYGSSNLHPGSIAKCTFNCIDDFNNPVNLLPPYGNRRSVAGVKITDVNNIQIGVTYNINYKNYFKNLDYGVYVQNSNVTFYNNVFGPVSRTSGLILPDNGFGIYAAKGSVLGSTMNIGNSNTSSVYRNAFNYCEVGIRTVNNYNLNIQRNDFTSNYLGAFITDNTSRNINILNNIASTHTLAGFWLNNFSNSILNFTSNSISNSHIGIYLSNNVTTHTAGLQVNSNTISGNMYSGIIVTNVEGTPQSNSATWTKILSNNISFSGIDLTSTLIRSGIRIESSARTIVEQCSVSYNASISDTIKAQRLAGVYMTLSDSTYLCSNTFTKMGMGVRAEGYCNKSKFVLNKFDKLNSTEGFGFKCYNATLGAQGSYSQSFDNTFYGFTINMRRGDGTMDLKYGWFNRNFTEYWFRVNQDQNISSTSPNSIGSTTSCGYPSSGDFLMSVIEGESNLDQSEAAYVNNIEENKYIDKYVEYRNFTQDVSLTSLNDEYKNIPLFSKINKAINQKDYVQATLLNNSIQPMNTYEENLKTVNDIYLRTWAKGNLNIPAADYYTLIDIAQQSPITSGFGVIGAWVMTQRFDNLDEKMEGKNAHINLKRNTNIIVSPNPAKEQILIEGIQEIDELIIYDAFGKVMLNVKNENKATKTINISSFKSGIYFIQLKNNNTGNILIEKFIVL